MKRTITDLFIRFILGGSAVALCYVLLMVIPWKSFAGIFAAFPAVMVSAVIIAGLEKGRKGAADIAFGAIAGMTGGLVCVITTLVALNHWHSINLAIGTGLILWFICSAFTFHFMKKIKSHKSSQLAGTTHN